MSTNALEKALWKIGTNPEEVKRFQEDAESYLNQFRLDNDERALLKSMNVGQMAKRNVSTLLLIMTSLALKGPACMSDYMSSMLQAREN